MTRFVSLLRSVNVGGRKVKMAELRHLFEHLGHTDVSTYLQSGNVVFTASTDDPDVVASEIERQVTDAVGFEVAVLVRTGPELEQVVASNPLADRSDDPTKLHVTFLGAIPDPARVDGLDPSTGSPDEYRVAEREVYLYCPNGYGRTKLGNAFWERRLGLPATTRNWRTVRELLARVSAS